MKILVVDDDFITRRTLQSLLSPLGDCETATNGREGYEAFCIALHDKEPFDLVTLDVEMPDMDGQTALERMRQAEKEIGIELSAGSKIVMISSHQKAQHVLPAFKAGCEAYLVKPLDQSKLQEVLSGMGVSL